jgi:hypothetical protein
MLGGKARAMILCSSAFILTGWTSDETKSDLKESYQHIWGAKLPNSPAEGEKAVYVAAPVPTTPPKGFTDLLPYVISAPNQEDAGSCLYMSLTGIAEWWLARLHPEYSRKMNGPLDLSERFLMSSAGIEEDENGVKDWRTDTMLLFNHAKYSVTNSSYPFAKGWYRRNSQGEVEIADANTEGAEYGTSVNWAEDPAISSAKHVNLPSFSRNIIFADPAHDQWNIGVMPTDIVEQVKEKLKKNRAPVHVIYNHYGYWHAVNIVGFDDDAASEGCQFVNKMPTYFDKEAADIRTQAEAATDQATRDRLIQRSERFSRMSNKVTTTMKDIGGCSGKGMFYVRDSLYDDPNGPEYDYDPTRSDDNGKWGKHYIMREYEWLRVVANHAVQITVKPNQ